jgi:hypothetical protein
MSHAQDRRFQVPLARIHVLERRYDECRLGRLSKAAQDAPIIVLKIPSAISFK